ncbi:hypothetical protein C0995_009087 [Termitomyces sp. Mi166|nr:hypothetical protein C0995_009087 [Termitomyces sp. Mi166\
MFSSTFFGITLACLSVHADVFPNFPAGDVQTTGKTCHITWKGDKDSKTAWKDMSIELMTGDNFDMFELAVATGLDGTVDGSFDWTCPEVTPNAAIYFYQFRSPHTSTYEWTTRFAIVSSSGQIMEPPNSTQKDHQPIPWGTGALVHSSIAVPPPVFTPTTTTTTSATPSKPPTSTATPSNVVPGVVSGCTLFFTETSLLCNQFEAWNGGACNILQKGLTPGLAYCVAGPTAITTQTLTTTTYITTIAPTATASASPSLTPINVASGVVSGCAKFFTRTTELCTGIEAQYGISVAQFESWNGGAGICDHLESGKAYCVAKP